MRLRPVLRGREGTGAGSPAARHPVDLPAEDTAGGRIPSSHEVPGVDAYRPIDIPADGWKQILRRALRETKDDNVPMLAAGVAFFAFVAMFPGLVAAVTVYGLVADPAQVQEQIAGVSQALPAESAELLEEQALEIATQPERELGLGLIVSLLVALVSASGGVSNLIKAVNIAYDEQETRSFLKRRTAALLVTVCAVVFFGVGVGLITVVPVLMDSLGLDAAGRLAVHVLRWVGLVTFVLLALALVYRYAPDRDNAKLRWVGLGSGVATALWVVGSALFSLYVSNFGKYGETYGAFAGVTVLLLWLFLSAFIVLLGAEINAEMEQQTAKDTTQGPEQPMGQRGAVVADSVAAPEPRR